MINITSFAEGEIKISLYYYLIQVDEELLKNFTHNLFLNWHHYLARPKIDFCIQFFVFTVNNYNLTKMTLMNFKSSFC